MGAKTGRNDPCPCGSGKKAKHCHGADRPAVVQDNAVDGQGAVAAAFHWLEQRHGDAMRESFMGFLLDDLWPEQAPAPETFDSAFLTEVSEYLQGIWLASCDLEAGHRRYRRVIDLVCAPHGAPLTQGQRNYLRQLGTQPLRLYRVIEAAGEETWRVMDAIDLTLDPFVARIPGAEGIKPGMMTAGRVLDVNGSLELTADMLHFPAPHDLRILNLVSDLAAQDYKYESERDFDVEIEIAALWLEMVLAHAAAHPADQQAAPDDGPDILFITDHYQVLDDARLVGTLNDCPALDHQTGPGWLLLAGDADTAEDLELEILRGARPDRLEVQYASQAAADAGRPWFEDLVGDAVRYLTREISDPGAMLDDEVMQEIESLPSGTLEQLLDGGLLELFTQWPDEPHPALGGKTPREVVRTGADVPQVKGLLLAIEEEAATVAREQGLAPLSWQFLWDDLGLKR